MPAHWDNLFWFERRSGGDREVGKRQLENNVTASFFKVLDELSESRARSLLENVGVSTLEDRFDENLELDYSVQHSLNEEDLPVSGEECALYGLAYGGDVKPSDSSRDSGQIDGVIWGRDPETGTREAGLFFEVKTEKDRLGRGQLEDYARTLGVEWQKNEHLVRWPDVHEELSELHGLSEKEQFLVNEFADYLEMMQMTKFKGFDSEELDSEKSREYIVERMRSTSPKGNFAEALERELEKSDILEDFEIESNSANTECYLVPSGENRLETPHFTAGFWGDQFHLQLNARKPDKLDLTERASPKVNESFVEVMTRTLPELESTRVHHDKNPVFRVRSEHNFQKRTQYNRLAFDVATFSYMPGITSDENLATMLETFTDSIRAAWNNNLGTAHRCISLQKDLPYGSERIGDKALPEYSIEFFEVLKPIFDHFAD